ncbi:KH domain-containing protein, partial [Acinetobacter baumannii]|uniref:KH domain-containing protein n=1 Tax=Acinetobacter baumannii TaxID=470 RepID=UPI000AC96C04
MTAAIRLTVTFPEISKERVKSILGAYNGHLKQIEQRLGVKITLRGDGFYIDGEIDAVGRAEALLQRLDEETESSQQI